MQLALTKIARGTTHMFAMQNDETCFSKAYSEAAESIIKKTLLRKQNMPNIESQLFGDLNLLKQT